MIKLIIFAFLLSAVSAQTPLPCSSPQQWRARFFEYDEEKKFFSRGAYFYDSIYRRERILDESTLQNHHEAFDTIRLFHIDTEYRFDLRRRICEKSRIRYPWRNFEVPSAATSFGESYIGSSAIPSANVLTTVWGYNFTDSQNVHAQYHSVFTDQECIPVAVTIVYPDNALHLSFYDVEPGIQDRNTFVPRIECLI